MKALSQMLAALRRVDVVLNMGDCEHPDFRDSACDCMDELWVWEQQIRSAISSGQAELKRGLPTIADLVRPIPHDAMMRFWRMWSEAQKLRDVDRMDELLTLRWLRFWWSLRWQVPSVNAPDIEAGIEIILQKLGLVPVPPERPSERAMRLASAGKPKIQSRRKPLPLP